MAVKQITLHDIVEPVVVELALRDRFIVAHKLLQVNPLNAVAKDESQALRRILSEEFGLADAFLDNIAVGRNV